MYYIKKKYDDIVAETNTAILTETQQLYIDLAPRRYIWDSEKYGLFLNDTLSELRLSTDATYTDQMDDNDLRQYECITTSSYRCEDAKEIRFQHGGLKVSANKSWRDDLYKRLDLIEAVVHKVSEGIFNITFTIKFPLPPVNATWSYVADNYASIGSYTVRYASTAGLQQWLSSYITCYLWRSRATISPYGTANVTLHNRTATFTTVNFSRGYYLVLRTGEYPTRIFSIEEND